MTAQSQDPTLLYFALGAFFIPLLSFFIFCSVPRVYSSLTSLLASFVLLMSVICAFFVLLNVPKAGSITYEMPWFSLGDKQIMIGFLLDSRSALMMMVVTGISFLVHLYSRGYMAGDNAIQKYFAFLGFFTFSMLGIVMASNLLMVFFFWELVGFSSYQLIGFWYEKPLAGAAATKAFIINRIGDAGFLAGLMLLWTYGDSLDIANLSLSAIPPFYLTLAGVCIFCGAIGKSAQFPLFTWLPSAMEGPVPVSALIHAATMVAAGVFLLARVYFLFTSDVLLLIAITGAVTSVIGALAALAQYDVKKVLAYSTLSQLGLMVMGIGAGDVMASELHLFTHAFFKAGLFLCAGSVIYSVSHAYRGSDRDAQDIRNLGGLSRLMPITFACMLIAGCGLAGIPLTAGFLSKDAVLVGLSQHSYYFLIAGYLVSVLTVIYTFRLIWFIFLTKSTQPQLIHAERIADPPVTMRLPMVTLGIASLWFLVSISPVDFAGWIYAKPLANASPLTTVFSGIIIILTAITSYFYFRGRSAVHSLPKVVLESFGMDSFYNKLIVLPSLKLSFVAEALDRKGVDGLLHLVAYTQVSLAHFLAWFDKSIIDGSVNGLAFLARGTGSLTRSFSSGKIQSYILWSMIGVIIFIVWILF